MCYIEVGYHNFCSGRFPLPAEKQIDDLEQRLGIHLPPEYRQFLLEYNGGIFAEPDIVPPSQDCPLDRLRFLCGIGASHPIAELASPEGLPPEIFDGNDPPIILPIGYTLMGNMLLLVTSDEGFGCIVMKQAFTDNSFFLAKGIVDFFGLLREPMCD